ncbi:MAG: extracellular solute-binding protein [Ruminococcus sp.]|nr:extracellular solute-binding protein [Ruminococcus sp.]
MKNMTRFTALTAALAIICSSAASCSSEKKKESSTASQLIQNAYKAEPIESDTSFDFVSNVKRVPGSDKVFVTGSEDGFDKEKLYVTDITFSNFTEVDTKLTNNMEMSYKIEPAEDGSLYIFYVKNDYGDMETPDYDDPEFDYDNYDFDALEEARVTSYHFMHLDENGKKLSDNEIKGMDKYIADDSYFSSFNTFGKDKFIASFSSGKETSIAIDKDGNVLDEIASSGFNWIMAMSETSQGDMAVCGYSNNGLCIKLYDTESMKVKDESVSLDNSSLNNIMSLYKGEGEYILYADTDQGLYGIKADGSGDEIINWSDSDISNDYQRIVIPLDNGEYITYLSADENESGFFRMTKRDASDFENTKVITIASLYNDYEISEMVKKFNKSHDDIRIKTVDYSKYDEYDEDKQHMTNSSERQLKLDISAGQGPDMISTYDTSVVSALAGKNVFADLGEFIDKDSDISRDDIMPNVLKACEYNGKLLSLSPLFNIETRAVKSKYCDKENWTFEDLKKTYEAMPEGSDLFSEITTRKFAFFNVMSALGDCIDYTKGTCNFEADKFKEILEFCSQFRDDDELMKWQDEASEEELSEFYNDSDLKYKDDKALIYNLYLSDFRDYKYTKQGIFNDDITLVGLPTSDGTGAKISFSNSLSILESSDAKDECWNFIKEFFKEDYYSGDNNYGFPSLTKFFEEKAENAMKKRTYTDENGKEHEIDDTTYINGKEIKIDPLTEDERDYIVDYVRNAGAPGNSISEEVFEIISDSIDSYFKNEKSADEVIELINSKVSILLSEQS